MSLHNEAKARRERRAIQDTISGQSQTYDIDFDETFAPVMNMSTMRTLRR
jgi:hypothetical protein